ncbi:hypothetical protein KCP69_11620 [Salmonella enterica subsp. enterica]|nr:hypothetical protein KCP69_11620 [Salmonella enterica subsp. enterica]
MSNAIALTDIGCIALHVRCDGDYLSIRVRDTGRRYSGKEVVRLFDPFFRVEPAYSVTFRDRSGAGDLRKIDHMMDGDISVDSEPGMGSQVYAAHPALWRAIPCRKRKRGRTR